jgi:leukotriene A-4 hydrolase/aminopeptidase
MQVKILSIAAALMILASCGGSDAKKEGDKKEPKETKNVIPHPKDVHTFSNYEEAYCTHLHLDIAVNFDSSKITGSATYDVVVKGTDKMIFDTKVLDITKVEVDGKEVTWANGQNDELLGTALIVPVTEKAKKVKIHYNTRKESEALQWLSAQQTAGKKHPYLFTQGEAILTRSWIPCQDTPAKRITYSAKVTLPKELMAVMSASNPQVKNDQGVYEYEMKQSIPVYLMALAAGDLEFKEIGKRTGVYTEPSMIAACANELQDTEKMLEAAEKLYGPYKWERYDVIVLPPSFPFGGMENPRLTFATPTIIAGDRSLISLIAHEMAHSWSGNLVTNATWDDFWLNEGFTVYFERRIMEELYGKEYSDMLALLGHQDLLAQIEGLQGQIDDTKLKLDLSGRSPDDGMTDIAYEKGSFFLRMLEATAGRAKFDAFLKKYFEEHQFQTISTEGFVAYLNENLIDKYKLKVNVDEWVFGQGLPQNCAVIASDRFKAVEQSIHEWQEGKAAKELNTSAWSTHEWMHFLKNLPPIMKGDQLQELDAAFNFTNSGNAEILCLWFQLAIKNNYAVANPKIEDFLVRIGRRKFLTPLYTALLEKDEAGKQFALKIYKKARPNYHFVATNTMDQLLGWKNN